MVSAATKGMKKGNSPMVLSVPTRGVPSTTAMSAMVPPMSRVTSSRRPASSPTRDAASTPAAGPESIVLTGFRAASRSGSVPPLDWVTVTGALIPRLRSPSSSRV